MPNNAIFYIQMQYKYFLPKNEVRSPTPLPFPVFAYNKNTSPVSVPDKVPLVIHILDPIYDKSLFICCGSSSGAHS